MKIQKKKLGGGPVRGGVRLGGGQVDGNGELKLL